MLRARQVVMVMGFVAALMASAGALAQQEDRSDDPRYRGLLADAVTEYNGGNFAEARALFRQAHQIDPNARTLRGMGMASFEMKEYVEALRYLRAALASDRKPLTEAQRRHTERLIRRSNAFVARYTLTFEPEDVQSPELRVDGAPATIEEDGTLVLDLGRHRVTATCPRCESVSRTVVVRGGEEQELSFRLELETVAPEPPASEPTVAPAPAGPPTEDDAGVDPGWWLVAGAGVAAVATVGTGVWWGDRNDELDLCRSRTACTNEGTLESQRNAAVGLTAAFGVAAVGLGVTGLVMLLSGDGEGDTAGAGLRCLPAPTGGQCMLRF